jgi:hypothetical protein
MLPNPKGAGDGIENAHVAMHVDDASQSFVTNR